MKEMRNAAIVGEQGDCDCAELKDGGDTPERRRPRDVTNGEVRSVKARHELARTPVESLADGLHDLTAHPLFLLVHVLWFGGWVAWNAGLLGLEPFDPFPFGLLTLVVSLEAIFLSIFVLMAQKREAAIAELREELMLQVNLRMEAEVTKTLQLVSGLYPRLGLVVAEDRELADMLKPLDVPGIERELTEQIRASTAARRPLARKVTRADAPASMAAASRRDSGGQSVP
jgi:uncharacterized membrane protein